MPQSFAHLFYISLQLKEDELVTRLRVKSARVRVAARASGSEVDGETPTTVTPVQPIQLFSQVTREEAEGEEEEGACEGAKTLRTDEGGTADGQRGMRSEASKEEEEETLVEELESDCSFQRVDDKEETF